MYELSQREGWVSCCAGNSSHRQKKTLNFSYKASNKLQCNWLCVLEDRMVFSLKYIYYFGYEMVSKLCECYRYVWYIIYKVLLKILQSQFRGHKLCRFVWLCHHLDSGQDRHIRAYELCLFVSPMYW